MTKNDHRQPSNGLPGPGSRQNNGAGTVDCLDEARGSGDDAGTDCGQASAPVDLIASCSTTHAPRNHQSSDISASAITRDVIDTEPRHQHGRGLLSNSTNVI